MRARRIFRYTSNCTMIDSFPNALYTYLRLLLDNVLINTGNSRKPIPSIDATQNKNQNRNHQAEPLPSHPIASKPLICAHIRLHSPMQTWEGEREYISTAVPYHCQQESPLHTSSLEQRTSPSEQRTSPSEQRRGVDPAAKRLPRGLMQAWEGKLGYGLAGTSHASGSPASRP